MNLNYVYTRLNVRDYAACKLFYQDVLGLKVSMANDAQEYTEFDAGATKITILNRVSFREATPTRLKDYIDSVETATYDPNDAKVVLTFTVPNLDEAFAKRLHQENRPLEVQRCQHLQQSVAIFRGWDNGRSDLCVCSRPRWQSHRTRTMAELSRLETLSNTLDIFLASFELKTGSLLPKETPSESERN